MRRLLPPLLIVMLVLVAPASAHADGSEVSRISDERIQESSGLAVSAKHRDLAYTINDAGNAPVVYAIKISTGEVVGATQVRGGEIEDTESIAIDGEGRMWLSDLGDNDQERDNVALYRFPEPGPGEHSVDAKRYPVTYADGAVDVEAFLVHPQTGAKFLVTKEKEDSGALLSLPAKLRTGQANLAEDVGTAMPADVSDGTFTTDGTQALIRTRESVHVFDPESWQEVEEVSVPEVEQGESIAMEPDGASFLIGSEGEDSPLIRVPFGAEASEETSAPPAEEEKAQGDVSEDDGVNVPVYLVVAIVAVGLLSLVAVWVAKGRRS